MEHTSQFVGQTERKQKHSKWHYFFFFSLCVHYQQKTACKAAAAAAAADAVGRSFAM